MSAFVILAIIAVLNSHLLILSGSYNSETEVLYCYTDGQYSDWILIWQKVYDSKIYLQKFFFP